MQTTIEIFKQLQSISAKTDKEQIIERNLDNVTFVTVMKFLMNNFIVTGLSKKKISKSVPLVHSEMSFLDLLPFLTQNNTGTDEIIGKVLYVISKEEEEIQPILKEIVTKEIKLGVDKTWNKVVPKELQVPVFDVMLAKSFFDYQEKYKEQEFIITLKLDGNRCVAVKENGIVNTFTRQGKPYVGLEDIENELASLPLDNYVFDGELLADMEGDSQEQYSETSKLARTKGKNKKGLVFHVFDMVPVEEFRQGKSKKGAFYRKVELTKVLKDNNLKLVKEVPVLYRGMKQEKIVELLEEVTNQGKEGVMINYNTPYVTKRTDTLLKVKKMLTADVLCVDVLEGDGRNKNALGAISVEFEHNKQKHVCKCGPGFTDEDRQKFYNNPELIKNKIVEVQYFEISKNQDGGYGMRFPVFLKVRDDKTEISMH